MAHDKIAHGRSLVEAGNREILDGYLDRIETVYTHLEPLQKEMLFSDLEKLVGQFEASPIKHSTYQPRANSNFDGQEAKKVRLDVEAKIKNDCPKLLLQGDFNIDTPSLRPFLPKLFADKMKQVILKTPTTPKGKWYDHILYKGFHHLQSYVITDVLTDHFPIYSEFEV